MIDSNIFDFHAELNDESMNVIGNNPNSIIGSYDNTISEDIGQDTITSSMNYGHLAHDISEETGETGLSDSFYESTHKVEISNSNNISSPYDSGFDDEHPIPSYKELRNAGFTDFEAKKLYMVIMKCILTKNCMNVFTSLLTLKHHTMQ